MAILVSEYQILDWVDFAKNFSISFNSEKKLDEAKNYIKEFTLYYEEVLCLS